MELLCNHGTDVSLATIFRTLQQLHFTRKGVSARAWERNDADREAFWSTIADLVTNPDQVMFTDESSRDRRTSGWTKGWSLKGTRCTSRQFFIHGERYSILPIMSMDGIITYDIIPGSVTSEEFLIFLRDMVVSR
jgi:hypothetical protein